MSALPRERTALRRPPSPRECAGSRNDWNSHWPGHVRFAPRAKRAARKLHLHADQRPRGRGVREAVAVTPDACFLRLAELRDCVAQDRRAADPVAPIWLALRSEVAYAVRPGVEMTRIVRDADLPSREPVAAEGTTKNPARVSTSKGSIVRFMPPSSERRETPWRMRRIRGTP